MIFEIDNLDKSVVVQELDRGKIYDRNGLLLSSNIKAHSLFVNSENIKNKFEISKLLWDTVTNAGKKQLIAEFRMNAQCEIVTAKSQLIYNLMEHEWIPDKEGVFYKPAVISKDMLHPDFIYDNTNEWLDSIGFGTAAAEKLKQDDEKKDAYGIIGISPEEADILKGMSPEVLKELINLNAKTKLLEHIKSSAIKNTVSLSSSNDLSNGHYVAPTIIELDDIDQINEEFFGPILHVIRYSTESLMETIDKLNEKGYGLTFGVHSRIKSQVDQIVSRINAGNIYVNRNQVGAIVGSQPFGGEGLSGTGPKAGGLHALHGYSRSVSTGRVSNQKLTLSDAIFNIGDIEKSSPMIDDDMVKKLRQEFSSLGGEFFNFLTELSSVGTANYTILGAFKYVIFQIPEVAYDQAAPVILLGCVLGMGHLVTTGQLLIFRVSGFSILKITWLTIKNALIFIFVIIVFGELFSPILTKYSESVRSNALGNKSLSLSKNGFWIRDGDNFINVENNLDGQFFSEIMIIETNSSNEIDRIIKSENALFDGNSLDMSRSEIFTVDKIGNFDNISLKERNSYNKTVSFDHDLVESIEKEPKDLTILTIIKQIQFLSDNKLRSGVFEVELYKRLARPVTLISMILLAMLFIFGSTRDVTLGRKIFFGVALALSFELFSRIGGALALSLDFSPLFSSLLPPILVMIISITLLTKKSIS